MDRQESVDDGFFDQVFNNNNSRNYKNTSNNFNNTPNNFNNTLNNYNNTPNKPETPSTKVDLPKNFERLLFSPVIECSENEANTPKKSTSQDISTSFKIMDECSSYEADKENYTILKPNSFSLQDTNNFPPIFNSSVNSNQSLFKQPSPFFSLNSPLGTLPSFTRPKPQEQSNAIKSRSKFACQRRLLRSESVNHDHNTSSSSDDSFIVEPQHIKRRKNSEDDLQVRKQVDCFCNHY